MATTAALTGPSVTKDLALTTLAAVTGKTDAWVAIAEMGAPTGSGPGASTAPDPAKWAPVYKYSAKQGEGLKVTFP